MNTLMDFATAAYESPEVRAEEDRKKTGRWRCIGCGKFLRDDRDWNQCAECDTRDPEDY